MASERLDIIIGAKDRASGVIKGVSGALGGLGKLAGTFAKIGAVGIGATAAAVTGLTVAVGKLADQGAVLQNIEDAFMGMGENMGIILADMKAATSGMASETELMKNYTDAALLVSDQFANKLPGVLESITKIASATGDSVERMMSDFVRGVGRESPMILDNLKIQMGDMEDVVARWAAVNRDAASALVDHSVEIADNTEKIADLRSQLEIALLKQSEFTSKTAESTKAANLARIEKLRNEIAKLQGGISELGDTTREFSEDEIKMMIENMDEATRKMIIADDAIAQLNQKAAGLPAIVNPIQQLKTAFKDFGDTFKKSVFKAVMPFLEKFVPKVVEMLDMFGRFVFVKDHFEDVITYVNKLPKPLRAFFNIAREVFRFFQTLFSRGLEAAFSQLGQTIRNNIGDDAYNKLMRFISWGKEVIKWIKEKIPVAIDWLNEKWALLREWFGRIADGYNEHLKEPLNHLWESIKKIFGLDNQTNVNSFWDVLDNFVTWLSTDGMEGLGEFIDWLADELPKAVETAKTKLNELKETLGPFLQEVKDAIFGVDEEGREPRESMWEVWAGNIENLKIIWEKNFAGIRDITQGFSMVIMGWIGVLTSVIQGKMLEALGHFGETIWGSWKIIAGYLLAFVTLIKGPSVSGELAATFQRWGDNFDAFINRILLGIQSALYALDMLGEATGWWDIADELYKTALKNPWGGELPGSQGWHPPMAAPPQGTGYDFAPVPIVNLYYSPAVSLADRAEVETKLVPLIDNAMRRVKRGKV